jgi:kynurenine 3-monooxygenase
MDAPEGPEEDRSVVIVGAGPAGLVTAAHFARRGYDVEVYEKRPPIDPSTEVNNSFTIVLNYKGISSIRAAGLSLDSFFKFPLLACVRHTLDAAIPFLQPPLGTAAAFERAELTKWLADSVQQQHPNIRIHYNAACTDIDFNNRQAHFLRPDGTTTTAE